MNKSLSYTLLDPYENYILPVLLLPYLQVTYPPRGTYVRVKSSSSSKLIS